MKYLLIDSCIYRAECFKFDKGLLNYISKLCQKNKIRLLYSDIIYKEVLGMMIEKCIECTHNISSAIKAINFLNDENMIKDIKNVSKEQLSNLSKAKLDKYIKQSKASIIELNIDIQTIIDDYFSSNPPFGSGDKKSEFPDAIVLQSLDNKNFEEFDSIYILSNDKDWAKFCLDKSKYKFFDDIYKCIIELSSDEDQTMLYDEQLYNWIIKKNNLNELTDLLENELLSGFDVNKIIDDNAEIIDNNSTLSLIIDPQCIYFDKENGVLDFCISFNTNVDFTTEGLDYNSAYYDKEDEKYYNLNRIMLHYTGEVQGLAVLSLDVSFGDKQHCIINKINRIEIFQDEINNNQECINVEEVDFDVDDMYD